MQKQVYTLAVDFSIQGDLAYLSHQETLKMFQRAFIRASVPVVFSKGFNPHPSLSIPFPRSVGTQSVGDRVCVVTQFSQSPNSKDWKDRIQQQLPKGCFLTDVQVSSGKSMFYPESVCYLFCFDTRFDGQVLEHLHRCQGQIGKDEAIEIQRYWAKKRRYKQFDLSPYLKEMLFEKDRIQVVCSVSQSGTVRVDEIMQWLNIATDRLSEPVCRTEINWRLN
jgi:radical SAM-linked protein